MPRYSTPDKILRFVYDETTTEENIVVIDKIQACAKAQDLLDVFQSARKELDGFSKKPSQAVINRILAHA